MSLFKPTRNIKNVSIRLDSIFAFKKVCFASTNSICVCKHLRYPSLSLRLFSTLQSIHTAVPLYQTFATSDISQILQDVFLRYCHLYFFDFKRIFFYPTINPYCSPSLPDLRHLDISQILQDVFLRYCHLYFIDFKSRELQAKSSDLNIKFRFYRQ